MYFEPTLGKYDTIRLFSHDSKSVYFFEYIAFAPKVFVKLNNKLCGIGNYSIKESIKSLDKQIEKRFYVL